MNPLVLTFAHYPAYCRGSLCQLMAGNVIPSFDGSNFFQLTFDLPKIGRLIKHFSKKNCLSFF